METSAIKEEKEEQVVREEFSVKMTEVSLIEASRCWSSITYAKIFNTLTIANFIWANSWSPPKTSIIKMLLINLIFSWYFLFC